MDIDILLESCNQQIKVFIKDIYENEIHGHHP